jgi:N-acetylglucosamine-6-sulfatase
MAMNVIFVLLDDTHYDAFAKMPYLVSFPDGHWTRFERAYFNNPYCGPSRVSLYTGRTSLSTGAIDHGTPTVSTLRTWDANNSQHMLGPWLQDKGYRTFHVGKYLNQYPWDKGDSYRPPGWSAWFPQLDDQDLGGVHNTSPFIHTPSYVNYALNENNTVANYATGDPWTTTGADDSGRQVMTPKYFTDKANVLVRQFLQDNAAHPMFLWLSMRATHGSVLPGGGVGIQAANRHLAAPEGGLPSFPIDPATASSRPSFNEADISDKPAWMQGKPLQDPAAQDSNQQDQWRCVQAVDELLRDVVTKLKALAIFDNTAIIVTSDNGWLRGEHRLTKKNVCYEPSIRTEVWIRHPGAPLANRTSTALVQNIDICPTICEITGARNTRPFNGQSFLGNILNADDTGLRDTAFIESYDVDSRGAPGFKGVLTATHKYVELEAFNDGVTNHPATTELYNLAVDPDELENNTDDPAYADVKTDLAGRLVRLKAAAAI